jgi:hypothetical protein
MPTANIELMPQKKALDVDRPGLSDFGEAAASAQLAKPCGATERGGFCSPF